MKNLFDLVLKHRIIFVLIFGMLASVGLWSLANLSIDAVPDITPIQVVINTKTGALDPEQIEKAVSFPIETEMNGIPHVKEIRSISKYGLSQVILRFADGTNIYWARQQVSERLQGVRDKLPREMNPVLAPITTGLGEVVMYAVLPKKNSALTKKSETEQLLYLRTIQDLVIAPHLKRSVSGVADIDTNGGYKKEIHIDINPQTLEQYGLTLEDIIQKVNTLGENFGGGYIQSQGKQVVVRSSGRLTDLNQIRQLAIKLDVYGKPIRLSAVAAVREDHAQRVGAATFEGHETVLGTVLMLSGSNSSKVAYAAEEALQNAPLPADVEIKLLYSRGFLVRATIKTVEKNLIEGAILVIAILLLILGNLRAAFLVALAIPASMLLAAIGMKSFGISASLMSLGAIDFGLLVDGSVVCVENILRRFNQSSGTLDVQTRLKIISESMVEVAKPVMLGLMLIMVVYLPVLMLEGVEGKLFHPMAFTVLMALGASLIVAIFLMPVLCFLFLKGHALSGHHESLVFQKIRNFYEPALKFSLRHRGFVLMFAFGIILISAVFYSRMGSNFMPALNEGDLVVNLTRAADISIDESVAMQKRSDKILSEFPEVDLVFSRFGTPETATDPMGIHLSDTFVILKKYGKHRNKEDLYQAMKAALEQKTPAQEVNENQPIEMRFNEILEGSRADVTLRIYGKDLSLLIDLLQKSIALIEPLRGVESVEMDPLTALMKSPVLSAVPDYDAIARYDVDIESFNHLMQTAMGGEVLGSFYESQWRFPIVLKLAEEYREKPAYIQALPVRLPGKGTIPLSRLAKFTLEDEVTTIAHDQGRRYSAVAIYISKRDIQGFVKEAQQVIEKNLKIPEGYEITWGGQFKNLQRSQQKLSIIVPLTLILVFVLLWFTLENIKHAFLVFSSIPLAMTGGIFALALRQISLSVSAYVGFIALIGIATLNAMVLIIFFNQLREKGLSAYEAVTQGTLIRLKPVLMTALVAALGFLPMALNTGIGAEVQRPLATVVMGGIFTATFLTLFVLPVLYLLIEGRNKKAE
jgi:cobalt-zinc-cadmium resistance protein CzcA